MPKKVVLKTSKNADSVSAYLDSIETAQLRRDAKKIAKLFKSTMGVKPKMWGSSIVGYGEYTYYRANGAEGRSAATGFSARKSGLTLYITSGFTELQHLLDKIGPHKHNKSCLYLKNLDDVELKAVAKLIAAGVNELEKTHDVRI